MIVVLRQAGFDAPIHLHGALEQLCAFYQRQGIDLGPLVDRRKVQTDSRAPSSCVRLPSLPGAGRAA